MDAQCRTTLANRLHNETQNQWRVLHIQCCFLLKYTLSIHKSGRVVLTLHCSFSY